MEYILINSDLTCGGITGTEPNHTNWTLTPYLGGFVKEQWNGTQWVEGATPEEIADAENQNNIELKKQAHDQLSQTDWYVTRFIETGKPIPTEILEQRQLIRNSI